MVDREKIKAKIKAKLTQIERDGGSIRIDEDEQFRSVRGAGVDDVTSPTAKIYRAVQSLDEALPDDRLSAAARSALTALKQHVSSAKFNEDEFPSASFNPEDAAIWHETIKEVQSLVDRTYSPLEDMTYALYMLAREYKNLTANIVENNTDRPITDIPFNQSVRKLLNLLEQTHSKIITGANALNSARDDAGTIMNEVDDTTLRITGRFKNGR